MLTTISEQSQLLSPKKLLALQRKIPISNAQQRQAYGASVGQSSSPKLGDNNQICLKGFGSESSSTPIKNRENEVCNIASATNASYIDSNQLTDESCQRETHRNNSFSGASVGNY